MSSHTQTPWFHDESAICGGGGVIARIPNHPENGRNWKNDAAFIVDAVNNHEKMVKALQKIADLIDTEIGEPLDEAIEIAKAALAAQR